MQDLVLSDWSDVDAALEQLGRVDLQVVSVQAELAGRLYDLVNEYQDRLAALNAMKTGIEGLISAFCLLKKDEFAKRRSRNLTYGKIAFKVSESIEIPQGIEAVVVATLHKLGWEHCIKRSERLDKGALKKLPDNDLAKCGVKRRKEDSFRLEPNLELVAERIGVPVAHPTIQLDMGKLAEAVKVADARPAKGARDGAA